VFDKAVRKSVEPHLESGEELLSALVVQGKGMTKWLVAGVAGQAVAGAVRDRAGRGGADAGDEPAIATASKMALVITSRRLLLFKAGGAVTVKAQELLTALPIEEVEGLVAGKAAMTKPLTITARGQQVEVEAPKAANTGKVVEAFERARALSRA